jgi:hypothetical protein
MSTIDLNRSFVILDEVGDPVSNQVFSWIPDCGLAAWSRMTMFQISVTTRPLHYTCGPQALVHSLMRKVSTKLISNGIANKNKGINNSSLN